MRSCSRRLAALPVVCVRPGGSPPNATEGAAVLFGPIETPSQRALLQANPDTLRARLVHWPMGRFGTLDEAAGAIAFLASDDSGFITGAALPLDGGITRAFTVPD